MAKIIDDKPRPTVKDRVNSTVDAVQGSQAWSSIFRPGSIFRKGYTDSPRNRSYVIMNSVLYHLHPVKVKRHAVKVSYTLCLGGLSFFLFILLTVTGIFLMFFYRPETTAAWNDIQNLQTSVTFGLLVRNMHRWGAHLMVLAVFSIIAAGWQTADKGWFSKFVTQYDMPAISAERISGKVTKTKVRHPFAPRSADASSTLPPMRLIRAMALL